MTTTDLRHEPTGIYEVRRTVTAMVECPRCGVSVNCEAETEDWTEVTSREPDGPEKHWRHAGYGPGTGECCGQILVVSWDCTYVLEAKS